MSAAPQHDPRPVAPHGSVSSTAMHEPAGKGGDDGFDTPQFPTGAEDRPATRTWVHPSEVGMAQRKRSDRRRGTLMAAALVLGGVSVLSVCVTLGLGSTTRSATSPGARDRAVAATVASLTVVRGVHSSTTTGIVIDDDGHIAVRAGAVVDATELWASTGSREPARAAGRITRPRAAPLQRQHPARRAGQGVDRLRDTGHGRRPVAVAAPALAHAAVRSKRIETNALRMGAEHAFRHPLAQSLALAAPARQKARSFGETPCLQPPTTSSPRA